MNPISRTLSLLKPPDLFLAWKWIDTTNANTLVQSLRHLPDRDQHILEIERLG